MKNIFQKKSLIISVVLFLFSCFIFIYFVTYVNNIKKTTQLAQEKWQTEESQKENSRALVNLIKSIEPQRVQLETHFVQSSNIVPFLDTIEGLVKEAEVKAEVVSVNPAKVDSSLVVEMKAVGSFGAIYKLITLLENSPYILEFVSFDIQNSNVENLPVDKNIKIKIPQWVAIFQVRLLSFVN